MLVSQKKIISSYIKNKNLANKYDLFLANWSLSETPINYRKKFFIKIKK